jgi:hypothetical protein
LGIVLTYIVVSLPALRGTGDFASFAPAIGACLAAFPLSFLGLGLAVAAVVRKEKWRAIVILGVLLNLILLLVSAPLVWTALQR